MKNKKIIAGVMLAAVLAGCSATNDEGGLNNKTKGAGVGAALGAGIGQLIGKDTKGTLIGTAVGTLAGLGWGAYRDKQEAELKRRLEDTDVTVSRKGDNINLSLPGGVTFGTNKTNIQSAFYEPLNQIAEVLVAYPETKIVVAGHTDNVGSDSYNQDLSERRARSVKNYFVQRGVASNRISIIGYGETEPIATNATEAGRAQNRRVEVEILPNQQ